MSELIPRHSTGARVLRSGTVNPSELGGLAGYVHSQITDEIRSTTGLGINVLAPGGLYLGLSSLTSGRTGPYGRVGGSYNEMVNYSRPSIGLPALDIQSFTAHPKQPYLIQGLCATIDKHFVRHLSNGLPFSDSILHPVPRQVQQHNNTKLDSCSRHLQREVNPSLL